MTESDVSHVLESVTVRCPYPSAQAFLANDMRAELGIPGTLRLRVPISGKEVTKTVVVMIAPGADPMHMEQPWRVRWSPEGGGPFPDFDGELTVRADEDWNSSLLELRGVYVPPGGSLGKFFDRTLGRYIATATALSLLQHFARTLEERYTAQETAKRSQPGGE